MPLLRYQIVGEGEQHPDSTTGARDGHLAVLLKHDHEQANAQVYSEIAANRLAQFLGIPIVLGVMAAGENDPHTISFASLRAAESALQLYDFTQLDERMDADEADVAPGAYMGSGHLTEIKRLCETYPVEAAAVAVFDLWIANADRALNFKAELDGGERGVLFALDQGSSLLASCSTIEASLEALRDGMRPDAHPFQKYLQGVHCGSMIERIRSLPEWAIESAMTYNDTIGNVTLDQQFLACDLLIERRKLLEEMVNRVLF